MMGFASIAAGRWTLFKELFSIIKRIPWWYLKDLPVWGTAAVSWLEPTALRRYPVLGSV